MALIARPVLAQQATPSLNTIHIVPIGRSEADALFTDYTFRDGEKLTQLRIHYVTLGQKHVNAQGQIDNAVLLLHWTNASSQSLDTPEFQRALFAAGSPLDVAKYFIVIPDDIGHGHSSKPSDGLKASFPHYGYGDMVDLQYKLVTGSLGIEHLHAVIGMSMGCMNAWQWAEAYPEAEDGIMPIACFPAPISGRNLLWRRLLVDTVHADPAWNGGNYATQPPSSRFAFQLARMMIDGVFALQQEVRTPEAADALLSGVSSATQAQDVNDLLYAFDSSRDFNAEPGLSAIKAKVFALNFEDDEFYRDSLGVLEDDIHRVPQGQQVVQRAGQGSVGHLTMSHPALWSAQVQAFMSSLGKDGQPLANAADSTTRPNRDLRARAYLYDAFGPSAFVSAGIQSGIDQARPLKVAYPSDGFQGSGKHPAHGAAPEWGEGFDGYAKRYASSYGQTLISTTVRYSLAELMREDVTYHPCACVGLLPRFSHVLVSPLVAYTASGRAVPSVPALVSPFIASEIVVASWYPTRFNTSDALRTSASLYYTLPLRNILNEFRRH